MFSAFNRGIQCLLCAPEQKRISEGSLGNRKAQYVILRQPILNYLYLLTELYPSHLPSSWISVFLSCFWYLQNCDFKGFVKDEQRCCLLAEIIYMVISFYWKVFKGLKIKLEQVPWKIYVACFQRRF